MKPPSLSKGLQSVLSFLIILEDIIISQMFRIMELIKEEIKRKHRDNLEIETNPE